MNWLQVDPQAIAERRRTAKTPDPLPTLAGSVGRGILGFTLMSVAGFAPWAIWGRWLGRHVGEAGLYAVCAVVFIGLSGPLLHRLIIGPESLGRFYKLFSVAFTVYSVAWMAGFMGLHGHLGGVLGLLAGTLLMAWILVAAFHARSVFWKVAASLFVLNALGYFLGGFLEAGVAHLQGLPLRRATQMTLAKLLWGVSYGVGFGAGLGLAFYFCQTRARELLAVRSWDNL